MISTYRVLYVDDDLTLLDIVKLFLEENPGFSVDCTSSGKEALEMIAAGKYDAVVSDYQMPIMDGISLLKKLRATDKSLPFILFTGKGREEVVIEALNNGADFYLQKGGNPTAQFTELLHKIKAAVKNVRAEEELLKKNEELAKSGEELKSQFDALAESERTTRFLVEQLVMSQEIGHNGSWLYNVVTDTTWGSAEAHRLFGFLPVAGDFPMVNKESCIPERERIHQALVDQIRVGKEYNLEYLIHPADGSAPKVIHSVARLEKDAQDNPIRVVGVFQDITGRKQSEEALIRKNQELMSSHEQLAASYERIRYNLEELTQKEQALRESELRFRKLFENNALGVTMTAPNFRFVQVNPAFCAMIGYTEEELTRMTFRDITHPDHIGEDIGHLRLLADKKIPVYRTDKRYIRKDGTILWASLNVSTIRSDDDILLFYIAQIEDVTERKQSQHALRQANKKLTLLSSITRHDIKNKILSLNAYLEISKESLGDTAKLSEFITKEEQIARTIERQIAFTKEYENIGVTSPVWQDCRTLMDTAANQVQYGQITVKNDLPAGAEVFADPLVIKVFYNLMDNAVRHGGKITMIRFLVQESGDDHVLVCEDDGNGIIAEEKEMIFERGFGKNTGLGLALSREILDITSITIKETGEPGKGARFEITVPEGAYRFANST
jgi:PAS domain S-box-containing protein